MKNLSYALSCIKKYVYIFLFYFLHLFCSHSSHPLRHPSFGLCTSSDTLQWRVQPFVPGRCPFFRALQLSTHFSLHPSSSLFETQYKLTHPPVKSLYPFLYRRTMFLGAYFLVNVFTLSCLGSIWFGTYPYYSLNLYVHL